MDSLRFTNNLLEVFLPIVDTTSTLHHGVGKFLTNILNPLTQNEKGSKRKRWLENWVRLPYVGNIDNNEKYENIFKKNVRFRTCFNTNKTAMFCSAKDNIPIDGKVKCYLQSLLDLL